MKNCSLFMGLSERGTNFIFSVDNVVMLELILSNQLLLDYRNHIHFNEHTA